MPRAMDAGRVVPWRVGLRELSFSIQDIGIVRVVGAKLTADLALVSCAADACRISFRFSMHRRWRRVEFQADTVAMRQVTVLLQCSATRTLDGTIVVPGRLSPHDGERAGHTRMRAVAGVQDRRGAGWRSCPNRIAHRPGGRAEWRSWRCMPARARGIEACAVPGCKSRLDAARGVVLEQEGGDASLGACIVARRFQLSMRLRCVAARPVCSRACRGPIG